jgi:hypothetical protein
VRYCVHVSMGSVKVCVIVYMCPWEVLKYVLMSTGLNGRC